MKKTLFKHSMNVLITSLLYLIIGCDNQLTPDLNKITETLDNTKAGILYPFTLDKFNDKLKAKVIDSQIIRFNDELSIKRIKVILERLKAYGTVSTCDCENDRIALLKFSPELTPEERQKVAQDELTNEGYGELSDNIQILLPRFAESYKQNDFKKSVPSANQVVVAVIDGGIDKSNPIFANKLWQNPVADDSRCWKNSDNGYDFTLKYDKGYVDTFSPHATIVSSILVNPLPPGVDIRLMDLRVFDKDGQGSLFDALCAIQFAIDNGADIVNMSWGYYYPTVHPLFVEYMTKLKNKGITVVASAGNDSTNTDVTLHYPSCFSAKLANVISVAALDPKEIQLASYSNFGVKTVSIAARGSHPVLMGGTVTSVTGTSYATPEVGKAEGILMSKMPGRPFNYCVDCILTSAVPLGVRPPIKTGSKLREPVLICP